MPRARRLLHPGRQARCTSVWTTTGMCLPPGRHLPWRCGHSREFCGRKEKGVQGCWSDEVDGDGEQKVQIFVKVDGARTSMMEMAMGDKVNDIVKRIPISNQDVYVTSGGRVLRGSDRLRSCGVTDGCTIQVTSRMR